MSRIGKMPIQLPDGITCTVAENTVEVTGPKGKLVYEKSSNVSVDVTDGIITVSVANENSSSLKAFWGLTRSIISNMVIGVEKGYIKSLEISGVGYKFDIQGSKVVLSVGYSHKVELIIPENISLALDEKNQNILHVSGIDKQLVGEFAAKIREVKKPEPYKGKGISYVGEYIRRKAGKSGAK